MQKNTKVFSFHTLLLLLFAFSGINGAFGQFGLQPGLMVPADNYYSYALKPGVGADFVAKANLGDIDSRYKIGFLMGYYVFQPTQDTFQTYAIGGNPVQLLPGYEVIHSYSILQFGLSNDFKILKDSRFSPFVGLDLGMDVFDISHDDYAETLIQSSVTNDIFYNYLIIPRAGVQYQLSDNWLFSLGIGRSMGFAGSFGAQTFWKIFITICHVSD